MKSSLSRPVPFRLRCVAALLSAVLGLELGIAFVSFVSDEIQVPLLAVLLLVFGAGGLLYGYRALKRRARQFGTPIRLLRVYRRHDRINRDHYVRLIILGGAGTTYFNWLTRPLNRERLVYRDHRGNGRVYDTCATTADRPNPGFDAHAYVVDGYDWRDAANVALRMWASRVLSGRTFSVYLPGHVRLGSRRGWGVTFTANGNAT